VAAKAHTNRIVALLALPAAGDLSARAQGRGGAVLWTAAKGEKSMLIWGPILDDQTLPVHVPSFEQVRSDDGGYSDEEEEEEGEEGGGVGNLLGGEALSRMWTWDDHLQVLQRVAVCCSVLHDVAVCCRVLQCVEWCCRVSGCGLKMIICRCCSVLQEVAGFCRVLQCGAGCCRVVQGNAEC